MWMSQVKFGAVGLLVVGVLVAGAGWLAHGLRATAVPLPDPTEQARVEQQGKTEPAGVPLELKLVAKQDRYALDLGGKTAEQFQQHLERLDKEARAQQGALVVPGVEVANFPAPPQVALELAVRNTGDRELLLWEPEEGLLRNGDAYLQLDLKGPGAVALDAGFGIGILNASSAKPVKLGPGQSYQMSLSALRGGHEGRNYWYWLQPGEYTLRASFITAVSPPLKGAPPGGRAQEFDRVTLTSNPITLTVVADSPKTEPAGVPLELKLTAKKGSYPLDLAGKTEAEVRQLVEAVQAINWDRPTRADLQKWDALPSAPAVDLEVELRNTGEKKLTIWIVGFKGAANVQPTGLALQLAGPAVLNARQRRNVNTVFTPANLITLEAGKSLTMPVKTLATSTNPGESSQAYWTKPGEYTLTAQFFLNLSPAPQGTQADSHGYGAVVVTSAPVKIKVEEKK